MTAYGEADRIRTPMPDGTYRDYSILHLLGAGQSILSARQGVGMPPIRLIEQSGPLQHGATMLSYRYGVRVLQIVISEQLRCTLDLANRRFDLPDLLRPSRVFPLVGTPTPVIYRRWLPGGEQLRGTDLELTTGSAIVESITGRFVHYGLRAGSQFTISNSTGDDGTYTVDTVYHDGRISLTTAMTATEDEIHWEYQSEPSVRDLYCVLEMGPAFDLGSVTEWGYIEALRFVATDPFWYGADQVQAWAVETAFDDLMFDEGDPGIAPADAGATFGATAGTGRWLFTDNFVSDEIAIPYWGHEGAVPVITITGPATDVIIRNAALETQIALNYAVGAGEVVTIDTLNLTVTNAAGDDLFLYLTGDVVGFIISPDAANDRVNTLEVEFSAGDANSEVSITWRNRYVVV